MPQQFLYCPDVIVRFQHPQDVVQNCQFFLMHSSLPIAIAMAEVPIPKVPVASAYGSILLIFSLSVKLHFHLRSLKICYAFNGLP
jgi:hypothetical protein